MTFQEAHKDGKNGLVVRRDLSEEELRKRLNFYFYGEEIERIINDLKFIDSWSDGNIAIIRTGIGENIRFYVISDGNYMKLIEP